MLLDLPPHPNVVTPLGVCLEPLCVVMTYCRNGSLSTALRSVTMAGKLTTARKVAVLRDVAAGMHHVAREGIVHKDLAARNVLLSGAMTGLVSDFGLSRLVNPNGAVYDSGIVSIKWSAPEAIIGRRYTQASDVWSFGVTCVETLTAEAPLADISTSDYLLRFATDRDKYRDRLIADAADSACGEPLRKLVADCLQNEVAARPTFQQLCQRLRELIDTNEDGEVRLVMGTGDIRPLMGDMGSAIDDDDDVEDDDDDDNAVVIIEDDES